MGMRRRDSKGVAGNAMYYAIPWLLPFGDVTRNKVACIGNLAHKKAPAATRVRVKTTGARPSPKNLLIGCNSVPRAVISTSPVKRAKTKRIPRGLSKPYDCKSITN